jgi:hypothetical protein
MMLDSSKLMEPASPSLTMCRVDHPSDVVWVTGEDAELLRGTGWHPAPLPASKGGGSSIAAAAVGNSSTADALKQQGNTFYLRGSHIDALHTYIKALAALREQQENGNPASPTSALEIDLLNNCAAVGLALNIPEGAAVAAAYARQASQAAAARNDGVRLQKALLREGKALMAVHRCAPELGKLDCYAHDISDGVRRCSM